MIESPCHSAGHNCFMVRLLELHLQEPVLFVMSLFYHNTSIMVYQYYGILVYFFTIMPVCWLANLFT